jgi:hypothetical protein
MDAKTEGMGMMNELELKNYQVGYKSGMATGKDLGELSGRHSMLSRVIETIQEMTEEDYKRYSRDEMAKHLWEELQDEN